MHDPDLGFLYFAAGLVTWRPLRDGSARWSVRVDVVLQAPKSYVAASAASALDFATTTADFYERGMSTELPIVAFTSGGRALHGSLPGQQPDDAEREQATREARTTQ